MKHPDLEAMIPLPLQRYAQVRDPCWHFSKHVVLRPIANVSVEQLTHMFGSKGVSPRMCALSFSSAAGAQRACEETPGCGGVNFMRPVICPVANPAAGTADPLFTLPWPTSMVACCYSRGVFLSGAAGGLFAVNLMLAVHEQNFSNA